MRSIGSSILFCLGLCVLAAPLSPPVFAKMKVNPNPLGLISAELLPVANIGEESVPLKIRFELAAKHHAYLDQFAIKMISPVGGKVEFQEIGPVVEFHDKFSKKVRKGVKNRGEIFAIVSFSSPPSTPQIELTITYQACTTEYCLLPKDLKVVVPLPIAEGATSSSASAGGLMGRADAQTPAWSFSRFEEALTSSSLWKLFLIVFLAGILTSFTPCIFPMIPITLAVLGARSERSKRSRLLLSLSYVLGIASTYSFLGLVAASTGALFGSLLGHPIVGLILALIFFTLAMSSFGFFELQAPAFIRAKMSLPKTRGGLYGAFFAGLLAGVIASPCVGPVLAGILAYVAKSQDLLLGFFLLFSFAFGLGQLFLLLGTFSHASALLPRSGRWMLTVKYVFGATFLSLSLYYAHPQLNRWEWYRQALDKVTITRAEFAKLPFEAYSEERIRNAAHEGKGVIIDFYADWCAACKELEIYTFSSPDVQALKDQFVFLKFDATNSSKEFDRLRLRYEILGLPHIVFYSAKGDYLPKLTLNGFEPAKDFAARMKHALK